MVLRRTVEETFRYLGPEAPAFALWEQLWRKDRDCAFEIRSDSDTTVGEEALGDLEFLKEHGFFPRDTARIMVRPEYEEALKSNEEFFTQSPSGGNVVTGQPGIGKTLFLYYVLCERLLAGKPTIFQIAQPDFYLFDEKGVRLFESDCRRGDLTELGVPDETWILVDSNDHLTRPAETFAVSTPWYIIYTASPIDKLWHWTKYKGSHMRSASAQRVQHDVEALRQFYNIYGPCPRNAYRWANDLSTYGDRIKEDISHMNWQTLYEAVLCALDMRPQPGFDLLLLLDRSPKACFAPTIQIVSPLIMRLIWDTTPGAGRRDFVSSFYNRVIDSPQWSWARGLSDQILELVAQDMLAQGGTWEITPLSKYGDPGDTHFRADPQAASIALTLPKLAPLTLDLTSGDFKLEPGRLYKNLIRKKPSFVLDDTLQATILYATVEEELEVNPEDLRHLGQLVEGKGSFRCVVVVPDRGDGTTIDCVVPLAWADKLEVHMMKMSKDQVEAGA